MPSFGEAVMWMVLAPIAVILDILAILIIQHYRSLYHSTDVALTSLLFTVAMTAYFLLPIPAVLELGDIKWSHELCSFYTWLSITLRFAQFFGLVILNVYWVTSLRSKPVHGHMFMSSMCMKISVLISWFVSVIAGLAPITGGRELFGYYSNKSCNFLPASISVGFGIFVIVMCLSSLLMGIISSSDTLLLFRAMKHIALTKHNAGRFHKPSVSGVSNGNIHAKYSELSVAHELCRLALCVTLVSSCINLLPFVVMQFMHLVSDEHRTTYEDVSLWLQLIEALILPNLLWMLSSRYRHAIVYSWKVHILRDSSAKEEDSSACTLQSYKVRAMEQQSKATLNGIRKVQANGKTSPMAQTSIPLNQRPSGNRISPIGQRANGGEGHAPGQTNSGFVTDLDDGMTVLSTLPQQTTENSNDKHLSNGDISTVESYSNSTYSIPLSKSKPPRKNMAPSNGHGPRVAFVDVAETSSDVGGSHNSVSTVSSPTKSLLSTPQRSIMDVKRTSSACSRREWKEKMRKKHLPAIFVNNSGDDDKEEKMASSFTDHNQDQNDHNALEAVEVKEVKMNNSIEANIDAEVVNENKQQNYSEDNFYVSSEYHYNYLSESFPRKISLRTQSTIDSDGISNMYESDDIDNILDTSGVSDSAHHVVTAVPGGRRVSEVREETVTLADTSSGKGLQNNGNDIEYVQVTYKHVNAPAGSVHIQSLGSTGHGSKGQSTENENNFVIKSSLEEFEENERNLRSSSDDNIVDTEVEVYTMIDDSPDLVKTINNNIYTEMKVIDLEATGDTDKETSPILDKSFHENHVDISTAVNSDSFSVSQNYDQLETVSGSELLQLRQQSVKTVKAASEFNFDSSSDDGGIDNDAFEGDSQDDSIAIGKDNIDESSFEYSKNTVNSYPPKVELDIHSKTVTSPQDITERFVTGKEDEEGEREARLSNTAENSDLKRKDFATNPFLRESFEVIVRSPEYQQKFLAKDNPFFLSVKPLPLPRQNTNESDSSNSVSSGVKPSREDMNKNVTSKPPIASKPISSSLADRIKSRPVSASTSNGKPPVPIRKPLGLKKQSSMELKNYKEREERFNRPRTSSEDELEKIFVKKSNSVLQDDPSFPEEDPPSSKASNTDPDSPVFYSMSPKKDKNYSQNVDDSIVIEPYGQRRPPWLDEHLQSVQNISTQSSQNIPHVKSYSDSSPSTSSNSTRFNFSSKTLNAQSVEEYDFDSVKIRGVTETRITPVGVKSNSENSNFFNSGSDSSDITPVSEEERPTFQFYQFDEDTDKGFEDALAVDYLTHSNVYSGFGLCFESIREEPEDSLSESASSFDGLGDSNSSSVFKTQAIVSRPSSRASVHSISNGDAVSSTNMSNRLSVLTPTDQVVSNEKAWTSHSDRVSYENFASVGTESFVTSERTSADGREEVVHHVNGNSSHLTPDGKNNFSVPDLKGNPSPWLEVKGADLDMSFESDFSQQNDVDISSQQNDFKQAVNGVTNHMNSHQGDHEQSLVNGSITNETDVQYQSKASHVAPVYF